MKAELQELPKVAPKAPWPQQQTRMPNVAIDNKPLGDDKWKQVLRVQALITERLQQLEAEARLDNTQDKSKCSGRYNTTDSSASISPRRWANEAILVGSAKKHVTLI